MAKKITLSTILILTILTLVYLFSQQKPIQPPQKKPVFSELIEEQTDITIKVKVNKELLDIEKRKKNTKPKCIPNPLYKKTTLIDLPQLPIIFEQLAYKDILYNELLNNNLSLEKAVFLSNQCHKRFIDINSIVASFQNDQILTSDQKKQFIREKKQCSVIQNDLKAYYRNAIAPQTTLEERINLSKSTHSNQIWELAIKNKWQELFNYLDENEIQENTILKLGSSKIPSYPGDIYSVLINAGIPLNIHKKLIKQKILPSNYNLQQLTAKVPYDQNTTKELIDYWIEENIITRRQAGSIAYTMLVTKQIDTLDINKLERVKTYIKSQDFNPNFAIPGHQSPFEIALDKAQKEDDFLNSKNKWLISFLLEEGAVLEKNIDIYNPDVYNFIENHCQQ